MSCTSLVAFMILVLLFTIVVPFPAVLLWNLLDKGLMVSWGSGWGRECVCVGWEVLICRLERQSLSQGDCKVRWCWLRESPTTTGLNKVPPWPFLMAEQSRQFKQLGEEREESHLVRGRREGQSPLPAFCLYGHPILPMLPIWASYIGILARQVVSDFLGKVTEI